MGFIMLSSIIKRIQKTISGPGIEGDALDELAAVNLNSLEPRTEPEPKPEVKPEPKPEDLKLEPKPPEPKKPKPAPKPEEVIPVTKKTVLLNYFLGQAKACLNIKEVGGPNKGPEVEKFQKAVDGKASGEPWCCCFVWFCILEAQKQYAAKFKEDLQSQLYKVEHVLTLWNLSPKESRLTAPVPGCLIIWQHMDANGNQTARGHIGIVTRVIDKTFVETIEGNTSNDAVVQDEGDGVYLLKRNFKQQTGTKRVVGFLLPWKELT